MHYYSIYIYQYIPLKSFKCVACASHITTPCFGPSSPRPPTVVAFISQLVAHGRQSNGSSITTRGGRTQPILSPVGSCFSPSAVWNSSGCQAAPAEPERFWPKTTTPGIVNDHGKRAGRRTRHKSSPVFRGFPQFGKNHHLKIPY